MKFTKKQAKAWAKLMRNLSEEAFEIGEKLCKEITPERYDERYATLYEKLQKAKECYQMFDEFLVRNKLIEESALKEGDECFSTKVKVTGVNTVELSQPLKNGSLNVYTGVADYGTPNAGIVYESKKGTLLDIAYVEQKKGELAKDKKDPENNEDLDVYIFSNPYTEDYTQKFALSGDDIKDALKEEES